MKTKDLQVGMQALGEYYQNQYITHSLQTHFRNNTAMGNITNELISNGNNNEKDFKSLKAKIQADKVTPYYTINPSEGALIVSGVDEGNISIPSKYLSEVPKSLLNLSSKVFNALKTADAEVIIPDTRFTVGNYNPSNPTASYKRILVVSKNYVKGADGKLAVVPTLTEAIMNTKNNNEVYSIAQREGEEGFTSFSNDIEESLYEYFTRNNVTNPNKIE